MEPGRRHSLISRDERTNNEILQVSAEGGARGLTRPRRARYLWPALSARWTALTLSRQSHFEDAERRLHRLTRLPRDPPALRADNRVEYSPPSYLLFVATPRFWRAPSTRGACAFTGEAIPSRRPSCTSTDSSGTFSASAGSSVLAYQPRALDSRLVDGSIARAFSRSLEEPAIFRQPPRLSPDGRRVAVSVRDWKRESATSGLTTSRAGCQARTPGAAGDGSAGLVRQTATRASTSMPRARAPFRTSHVLASRTRVREDLVGLSLPATESPARPAARRTDSRSSQRVSRRRAGLQPRERRPRQLVLRSASRSRRDRVGIPSYSAVRARAIRARTSRYDSPESRSSQRDPALGRPARARRVASRPSLRVRGRLPVLTRRTLVGLRFQRVGRPRGLPRVRSTAAAQRIRVSSGGGGLPRWRAGRAGAFLRGGAKGVSPRSRLHRRKPRPRRADAAVPGRRGIA